MECFLQFIERPFLLPVESRFSYAGNMFSRSPILSPAAATSNSHFFTLLVFSSQLSQAPAPRLVRVGDIKNFVSSSSKLKSASSAG